MKMSRLVAMSLVYNFKEYLHNRGFNTESGLTAASGLPYIRIQTKDQFYKDMVAPSIVIYPFNISDTPLQIGGGYWIEYSFNFDIYGVSEAQTLELCDYTREFLESNSSVLRYDQYRPVYQVLDGLVRSTYQGSTPTLVCSLVFDDRRVSFLDRFNTIGEMKAHAAQVSVSALTPSS